MTPTRQAVVARAGRAADESAASALRPIYVIGAPFSGATLLARAFAQDTAVPSLIDESVASLGALRVVASDVVGRLERDLTGRLQALLPPTNGRGPVEDAGMLRRVLEYTPPVGIPSGGEMVRWVAAAPEYVFHVHLLSRLFPGAKFIHVLRDVDSVVRAATQTGGREGADVVDSWQQIVEAAVEAERALGSDTVLRVPYSSIEEEPEATLARCGEFVGHDFAPECVWPLRVLARHARAMPGTPQPKAEVPQKIRASSETLLAEEPRYDPDPDLLAELRHRSLDDAARNDAGVPDTPFHRLVTAIVPVGASPIVVSRGDDALLELGARAAGHFPQTPDGVYAGHHPGTSEEAVEELEVCRRRGATHVVLPDAAFWWLDHYEGLREHLERNAKLVLDSEVCRVFALQVEHAGGSGEGLQPPARRGLVREPGNREAFRVEARQSPPLRRRRLPGDLWAITTFYNPAGYGNKSENYRRFREGLKSAGVPLLTIEAAFGDGEFELGEGDAEQLLQLRGGDPLWQKERLMNIGLQHLPADCDKVAWLDGDILFADPNWPDATARLLEQHFVVQPFSHCVRLQREQPGCDPATLPFGISEGELFYGVGFGIWANGSQYLPRFFFSGHTGYGWAARRSTLEKHGFYDMNLFANGDMDFAQALWGNTNYFALEKRGPSAREHVTAWARKIHEEVNGSVGYAEGLLLHLWHGDHKDRLYNQPLEVMASFDPARDLVVDSESGLYAWSGANPALMEWAAAYFAERREEGT